MNKISEEPNNSENTINGDLVGEYGSNYGRDNFEESGVSENMDLTGDYCNGVYGGNSETGENSRIRY